MTDMESGVRDIMQKLEDVIFSCDFSLIKVSLSLATEGIVNRIKTELEAAKAVKPFSEFGDKQIIKDGTLVVLSDSVTLSIEEIKELHRKSRNCTCNLLNETLKVRDRQIAELKAVKGVPETEREFATAEEEALFNAGFEAAKHFYTNGPGARGVPTDNKALEWAIAMLKAGKAQVGEEDFISGCTEIVVWGDELSHGVFDKLNPDDPNEPTSFIFKLEDLRKANPPETKTVEGFIKYLDKERKALRRLKDEHWLSYEDVETEAKLYLTDSKNIAELKAQTGEAKEKPGDIKLLNQIIDQKERTIEYYKAELLKATEVKTGEYVLVSKLVEWCDDNGFRSDGLGAGDFCPKGTSENAESLLEYAKSESVTLPMISKDGK